MAEEQPTSTVPELQYRCTTCGEVKGESNFYKVLGRRRGRAYACIPCWSERAAGYRRVNRRPRTPEKIKVDNNRPATRTNQARYKASQKGRLGVFARSLERRFNISYADFLYLRESQGGRCAICGCRFVRHGKGQDHSRAIAVDHCHKTGKVRGILCRGCNLGVGMFYDDAGRLAAAAEYVRRTCS